MFFVPVIQDNANVANSGYKMNKIEHITKMSVKKHTEHFSITRTDFFVGLFVLQTHLY